MDQQALSSETRAAGAFTSVVDVADFNERVVGAYNNGLADKGLPADGQTARSIVPAATGALRDFSYIAPEIPEFIAGNCVGCMECVVQCPDTAILGKVAEPSVLEGRLARIPGEAARADAAAQWAVTNKYFTLLEKKGVGGGKFGIFIDPTKCKGCAECVDACGDHNALRMVRKSDKPLEWYRRAFDFYRSMPETPARFINEKALADMMLAERSLLYVGGSRLLHGLRRSHSAAHDAGGDRLPVRPGQDRHRRGDRLQHGLHFHLPVQSISRLMDELPV